MKDKIIEQTGKELKLGTAVDLVIMLAAVTVTLILFAIAAMSAVSSVESSSSGLDMGGLFGGGISAAPTYSFKVAPTVVMCVTLIIIAIINWYGVRMVLKNRAQRAKVNAGLAQLLKDEGVDQYNDGAIFQTYERRYSLFAVVMGSVAAISIIAPLAIFIDQMMKI